MGKKRKVEPFKTVNQCLKEKKQSAPTKKEQIMLRHLAYGSESPWFEFG